MKQVTLHIPDSEFDFFMQLIQKFKYKTSKAENISIPEEVKLLVDKRRRSAKASDYTSISKSNQKLKKKYGF
jgi:hypothetical protein